jgi:hypothetical protein
MRREKIMIVEVLNDNFFLHPKKTKQKNKLQTGFRTVVQKLQNNPWHTQSFYLLLRIGTNFLIYKHASKE